MISFFLNQLNKWGFNRELPSREKPANFRSADYRPGGQERLKFRQPMLRESNTAILMDDSGSMKGKSWRLVRKLLAVIVDAIMQNDHDGIDWYWLNEETDEPDNDDEGIAGSGYSGVKNPDFIAKLFDNRHVTPDDLTYTGARLTRILKCYIKRCWYCKNNNLSPPKPLNLIVWTDGCAMDKSVVESIIVWTANELDKMEADPRQLGIQFLQVNNIEGVGPWLKKLDDDLKKIYGLKRDIVDTKSYDDILKKGGFNGETLFAILLGAMLERLDDMQSVWDAIAKK